MLEVNCTHFDNELLANSATAKLCHTSKGTLVLSTALLLGAFRGYEILKIELVNAYMIQVPSFVFMFGGNFIANFEEK